MYTYSSEYEIDYNTLKEEFQEIIELAQDLDIEEEKYNVLIAFKNEMFKLIKEVMSDPIYTEDYVVKFLSNCNIVFINTWKN